MASGLCVPHKQAAHMAAPTEEQNIKIPLPTGSRPHMAQSGHWPTRYFDQPELTTGSPPPLGVQLFVDAPLTLPKFKTFANSAPVGAAGMGNSGPIVFGLELITTANVVAVVEEFHAIFQHEVLEHGIALATLISRKLANRMGYPCRPPW